MRGLVVLFVVLGTSGALIAGVSARNAVAREEEAWRAAEAENPGAIFCGTPAAKLETAGAALLAAVPLGLLGGILVLCRGRKAAAAVLLTAYAVPAAWLVGLSPEVPRVGLLAPVGLLLAGVLAPFIPPAPPRPAPAHRFGHPVEYDMAR